MKGNEMKGMLTLTVITGKALSLNYGENIGNVSILKKVTLGDGGQVTYVSDKALKYEIRRKGKEEKGWKLLDDKIKELISSAKTTKKDKSSLDVDQFGKSLIKEYEEFDLFGGLFTNLKGDDGKKIELSYGDSVKRTSPVKISYAFSISKFQGDMDFMNNIDAYNRYIKHVEQKGEQAIVQSEQHLSHYYYTIAIDLDRIGVWEKENGVEDVISNEEKAKRIKDLLDIISTLSRQIRGRCENLSPIFVIGGVYKVKNPFFMGSISAKELGDNKLFLDVQKILDCKNIIPQDERENTLCGLISGVFVNEQEIREKLMAKSIGEVFEEIKRKIDQVYGVSQT
jgi:CRISPR-associated protein Cst2